MRNALNVQIDREFAAGEDAQTGPEATSKPVSMTELTAYLRQHIRALDDRSAARMVSEPPDSQDQKAEMVENAQIGLGLLKNRDDPRGDEWVASVFDKGRAKPGPRARHP